MILFKMKFIILILLTPTFLSANLLDIEGKKISYELSINDFKVSEDIRQLSKTDEGYLYTSDMNTTGITAIFKPYRVYSESKFIITDKGIESLYFKKQETSKKDFEVSVAPNDTQVKIASKVWQLNLASQTIDTLNVALAIAYKYQQNPNLQRQCYQVLDVEKLAHQCYDIAHTTNTKDIVDDFSSDKHNLSNDMVVFSKVFDNDKRQLKIFLDKNRNNLPVKITQAEKNGDKYEYIIIK